MRDNVPVAKRIQQVFQSNKSGAKELSTQQSSRDRPGRLVDTTLCVVIFMAVISCIPSAAGANPAVPLEKTILLINPADILSPSAQKSDQGMYKVFAKSDQRTKILSEYLHLETDSILEHDVLALIKKKYQSLHVDLIIARGEEVLDFLELHGDRLWPNIPVLYFSISDTSKYWIKPPPGKSGVFIAHNYADNLALIKEIQPAVRRIVQIADSNDMQNRTQLQRELATAVTNSDYLSNLTIETMPTMTQGARLKYIAELPSDTALLALTLDSAGDDLFYSAADTIRNLSSAARVPIYGMRESFIGNGVVGGYFVDMAEHGRQTATLALQILAHSDQMPAIQISKHHRCAVDELQLQRWKLKGGNIPFDCERMFYVPAFWELHGYKVISGIVIGFILLTLCLSLNFQWLRRRRAEEETKHQRTALAHVARLGSVGELTASIVHEINQPLGAILTNADAAAMMLKQHSSTDEELNAILNDIREDNLRASRIIHKLRALLSKRALESVPLSLNDVVASCKSLLGNMAIRHHVVLQVELSDNLPQIMGDNTHLQQVLINLASNGMEAMSVLSPPERKLTITTSMGIGDTVLLIVADSGPGIPSEVLPHMFESFYTTKPDGMGMGLAIVQTIIDVHGGSIDVRNREHGGAVFKITLPCASSNF